METLQPNGHDSLPTTPSSSSSCLFLRLPTEVREFIYICALSDVVLECSISRIPPVAVIGAPKRFQITSNVNTMTRQRGLPAWLLTCRLVLYEGAAHIARAYVFTIQQIRVDQPAKKVDKARGDVLNRIVVMDMLKTVKMHTIQFGWIGRSLAKEVVSTSDMVSPLKPKWLRLQFWAVDAWLLQVLHKMGVKLKEVRMHWSFRYYRLGPMNSAYTWDESLGLWLDGVQRVVVRLGSYTPEVDVSCGEGRELVARAAGRLVGGTDERPTEGKETHKEFCIEWQETQEISGSSLYYSVPGLMSKSALVAKRRTI